MLVRIARAKVGHRQAPHKQQSPPREGFVVYSGRFLRLTYVACENTPPANLNRSSRPPARTRPYALTGVCFSAGSMFSRACSPDQREPELK